MITRTSVAQIIPEVSILNTNKAAYQILHAVSSCCMHWLSLVLLLSENILNIILYTRKLRNLDV